jgi:glycosyltransferase involved in cell wall biosynthesis
MKLQILIPQYKETDDIVKPLLDSIAIQQNVDFNEIGAIIANDGTDVRLSEDLLTSYPFQVDYIQCEHKGVSATRNACLDHSTAEYVMFCDADDMFANVYGLWLLFREIENGGFDSLTSVFIEETRLPNTKTITYIERGRAEAGGIDCTFVHGKVHRRKYLLENNIRWNDNLTIHEDSYFNCLCQRLANPQRVKYCPTPFYLWKWRDESVCRHDPKYILKTFNNMLESNTALVKEFLKRSRQQDAQFYITSMIFDSYYTMNKDEWLNQENVEYRNNTEKRFKQYYIEFKSLFETTPIEVRNQIIVGVRNRFFQEGMMLESITFESWIKHIMEL